MAQLLRMLGMHSSACGRFLVLDSLHVDREVMMTLVAWATAHCLSIQDAVQLALVAFAETITETALAGQEGEPISSL